MNGAQAITRPFPFLLLPSLWASRNRARRRERGDGARAIVFGGIGLAVMGALFSLGSATTNVLTARPEAVAAGMRVTFAVAAILIVVALAIAFVSHALSRRIVAPSCDQEDGRSSPAPHRRRR